VTLKEKGVNREPSSLAYAETLSEVSAAHPSSYRCPLARVSELAVSDPERSLRHRVVQVSATPPRLCPLREREVPSNHRVGASQEWSTI